MGRNRFTPIGLRDCLLKFNFEFWRYREGFARVPGENGHDGPFRQRVALDHDLPVYDDTGSKLHSWNVTPEPLVRPHGAAAPIYRRHRMERYPTKRRAFANIRYHGDSSPHASGCHDICTVRNTRSGCGIRIVKRPSAVVSPVIPCGEPLGLYG